MSAFGSSWKDIDETRPGTPYVVDSDGWGWFLLFILASVPLLIAGSMVKGFSLFVVRHPVIFLMCYMGISVITGACIYLKRHKKWKICGIIAVFLTMLPAGIVELLYAVPVMVIYDSLIAATIEWILVILVVMGIAAGILLCCNLLGNGIIHLVISVLFSGIVFYILYQVLSSSDKINWEVISNIYRI